MSNDQLFRTLDEIKSRKIEWLWEPRIPYNKMTIMEGDPEVGKSYLCMHLAALVTTGGRLPDGSKVDQGRVLYISSEDDAADTIRPRMEQMGADLKNVRVLDGFLVLTEQGQDRLREEMDEFPPDLVVIDTLYSFLSDKVDLGKPTSIRASLHQLDRLFKEFGPAVVVIRHWTKGGKGKAIYRGVGSIDVIGVVRTGLVAAKHPENENLRILAQVKNNIGPKAESLTYEMVPQKNGMPIIKWHGKAAFSADDLEKQGGSGNESEYDRAVAFLKEVLSSGPMFSPELFAKAREAGISRPTLNRAKKEASVVSKKMGKVWEWRLSER